MTSPPIPHGRTASLLPGAFIAPLFATVNPPPMLAPTWIMAPTMDAPVVRCIDGARQLDALNCGNGHSGWAGPKATPAAFSAQRPAMFWRIWPVGKAVGNFRNDGPQLLEPATVTGPTLF